MKALRAKAIERLKNRIENARIMGYHTLQASLKARLFKIHYRNLRG